MRIVGIQPLILSIHLFVYIHQVSSKTDGAFLNIRGEEVIAYQGKTIREISESAEMSKIKA